MTVRILSNLSAKSSYGPDQWPFVIRVRRRHRHRRRRRGRSAVNAGR